MSKRSKERMHMFTLQDLMAWNGQGLEKASFDFHCAAGKYKNLNDELVDVNDSKLRCIRGIGDAHSARDSG